MIHYAFFNPDAPERIVSATRSSVSLLADWQEQDEDDELVDEGDCILTISRETYLDAMTEWLNQKSRHEIGIGGSIMFTSLRQRPEGAMVPAHLIEMAPDGVNYGTPEYAAFANRKIPIVSLVGTCCTEFDVFLHTEDADEDDAEDSTPATQPETDEPANVSFFRPSTTVGAEPIAP